MGPLGIDRPRAELKMLSNFMDICRICTCKNHFGIVRAQEEDLLDSTACLDAEDSLPLSILDGCLWLC